MTRLLMTYSQGFYYLIPLLPFMALGNALLILRGIPQVYRVVHADLQDLTLSSRSLTGERLRQLVTTLGTDGVLFVDVFISLIWIFLLSMIGPQLRFSTKFSQGLSSPQDASSVVSYLREHVHSQDVALASPQVAWALPGFVADVQQAVVCEGGKAHALPPLSSERLAFDCS